MTQLTSPFLEGKYGWNYGESGWNTGMDENLLKFSFLFDGNVDAVVSTLPATSNGTSYFLTTDKRLYFCIGSNYYSSPTPKWFEFKIRSTGQTYQFNGTEAVVVMSSSQTESRVTALEAEFDSLGTAAFRDTEFFASKSQLDVSVANSQSYTDSLKTSLANTSDFTKGSNQIGQAVTVVSTTATIKNLLKTSASKFAITFDNSLSYALDPTDTTTVDSIVCVVANDGGRWKLVFNGKATAKMFGAKGDNLTDDILAIEAATNFLVANGGGVLDFGSGPKTNYRISRPLRLRNNISYEGSARILPAVGFSSTGVSFPTYITGTPQVYSCLFYFNDGPFADDPNNFGTGNVKISSTIILDCQYNAQASNGIIVEGMTNSDFLCQITQCAGIGLWSKYSSWGNRYRPYITSCRTASIKLGPASNGINLDGLVMYGLADTPTYHSIIDGDNNGISFAGAFSEKCVNQILCVGFSGPMTISGVDFEICSGTMLHVDGTGTVGRAAGPVTLIGSFCEATSVIAKATNAIIHVTGCRLRNSALAFSSIGAASRITYDNCVFENITSMYSGQVVGEEISASSSLTRNALPYADTPYIRTYGITNQNYSYAPTLETSGINFYASLQDVSTQRMLGSASWTVNEMRNGSIFSTAGINLDLRTGAKRFLPWTDADHTWGSNDGTAASRRLDKVYSRAFVQCAGVGATVTPSVIGEMVMQFTSNTQVTIKAMGTDGVVRSGNITLA